jgi:hypothetical protein
MALQDWVVLPSIGGVSVPTNLLRLIAQIEHDVPATDYAAAVAHVVQYFASGGTSFSTEIAQAIKAAGLKDADLQSEWNAIATKLKSVLPASLQPLASPLNALDKPVTLPLMKAAQTGVLPAGSVSFDWNAGEQAEISFEAMNAAAVQSAGVDITLGTNEIALRAGVVGTLSASIAGSIVPAWGTIGIKAGTTESAELDLYVHQPANRILLESLLTIPNDVLVPGDLDSAFSATAANGFAQVRMGLRGSLFVAGSITAGYQASASTPAFTAGAPELSVVAKIGVTLGAQFKRDGAYSLVVQPDTANSVKVRIEQARNQNRTATMELGADVSVQGLAENLNPILEKLLPDDTALWNTIAADTDIRSLLNQELAKVKWLAGNPIANELAQILSGNVTVQSAAGAAEQWVSTQLTDLIHSNLPWLTADANAIATQAATAFLKRAGIDDSRITDALAQLLSQPIKDAQTRVGTAITGWIQNLTGHIDQTLVALLQPLGRIGEDVNALLATANASIDLLVAAIKKWFDAYSALRKQIFDGVKMAAEAQIALAITAEYTRQDTTTTAFEATFFKSTDTSRAIYRAAWLGRLEGLQALATVAKQEGSAAVGGSVASTLSDKFSTGISIQFAGWELLATQTLYSEVTVNSDLGGRVLVVLGNAKIESVTAGWRESYKATLGIDADLLGNLSDGRNHLQLGAAFSVQDQELHPDELDTFIKGLTDFDVLAAEAGNGLYDRLSVGGAQRPSFLQNVSLGLLLQVTNADFQALLQIDSSHVFDLAASTLFEVMDQRMVPSGGNDQVAFMMSRAQQQLAATGNLALLRQVSLRYPNGTAFHDAIAPATGGQLVGGLHPAANAIWYVAKQAAGIADALSDLRAALAAANAKADAGTIRTQVEKLMKDVVSNEGLAKSTQASHTLFTTTNEVPWSTLGFYITIGKLLDRAPPYGLAVEAIVPGPGGDRTFIIA